MGLDGTKCCVCLKKASLGLHSGPQGSFHAYPWQEACQGYQSATTVEKEAGACVIRIGVKFVAGIGRSWVSFNTGDLCYLRSHERRLL